ncbi:MAG TPA: ATP-binding protein [Polyangium sp.]|nr:ATP-binding protein [Polyangium sp.]
MNRAAEWLSANQRFVSAFVALLRALVERANDNVVQAARADVDVALAKMPAPPALTRIGSMFGLSSFERQLLMLCAGVELDGSLARACARSQSDPESWLPTFGLAMSVLSDAHWSAITPAAPLRRYRLLDVLPGRGLSASPLRIQERILHYIVGVDQPDEALVGMLSAFPRPTTSSAAQDALAARIVKECERADSLYEWPVVELVGPVRVEKLSIAAMAVSLLGLQLQRLDTVVHSGRFDDPRWMNLVLREMRLTRSVLVIDGDDLDEIEESTSRRIAVSRFVEQFPGPLFVLGKTSLRLEQRPCFTLNVERTVERHSAVTDLLEMAERVETNYSWDELVVPDAVQDTLREIVSHVKQSIFLHKQWGFVDTAVLGVHALFTGASGTGKTMAAAVLARELGAELYRVDLSRIASKYIGETEKNLRRLFGAAAERSCVLLFDEAEALFGARGQVKDSHDRYANLEMAYLLQRMESHRGLSILTTNMRDALEPALQRRLRFVVEFPFPRQQERERIWRQVFPKNTPTNGLDFDRLARMNIAGGNIRNIALVAAGLAAGQEKPVEMQHVRIAIKSEYQKLGRMIPAGDDSLLGDLGEQGAR